MRKKNANTGLHDKNKILMIKYNILAIEIETAMLTPCGYQNNKQKRTLTLKILRSQSMVQPE